MYITGSYWGILQIIKTDADGSISENPCLSLFSGFTLFFEVNRPMLRIVMQDSFIGCKKTNTNLHLPQPSFNGRGQMHVSQRYDMNHLDATVRQHAEA